MRYDVSNSIEKGNTHYLIAAPKGVPDSFSALNQLTGIELCSSPAGTGVNAGANARFGDAKKGNCKAQVCVSDKYGN